MRDRRNTSLSVSSTSSSSSNTTLQEKQPFISEPSSPTLPAPATTKENVTRPNARSRFVMAARAIAVLSAVVLLYHFVFCGSMMSLSVDLAGYESSSGVELVGGDALPNDPVALIVEDKRGNSRWTMSIPSHASFPLRGQQYRDMCTQGEMLRDSIAETSRLVRTRDWLRRGRYYAHDATFMDIDTAEHIGVLPVKSMNAADSTVCESSLTFALEAQDSSFGKSLLMLWLSYGLAKKEGRAFFVDDSKWAYGRYRSYFAPPPSPKCERPPPHHIVPCPHSAKHLIVSASTMRWTFGSSFEQEFLRLRKHGVERSHRVFELIRTGYEDLFKLVGEDALYATSRIAKFKDDAHKHSGSTVGMHIRRGDRHPHEYEFSRDYLPVERYATAARKLLRSELKALLPHGHTDVDDLSSIVESVHSPLLLASDDPEVITSAELGQSASPFTIQKSQERIQLATKATLDRTSPALPIQEPGSAYVKHVDENSGWEGGFYSALFFGAGRPKQHAGSTNIDNLKHLPTLQHSEEPVSDQVMSMRELVGRAYLLDLAVLGESDGVVCGISSSTCRLLGVMLGWDAVKEGKWVNVDDGRAWSWDGRRV